MKKIIFLLLSVIIGLSSYAQLPGSKEIHITVKDENNIPDRESKVNHLGRIHRLNLKNKKKRGKNDESSRSDSSSDFNDNPFDMKEDRENFW